MSVCGITVDEAIRIFPEGVAARSGLFMCELCGQYVLLTREGEKARHFRHSSAEKSKNCPERTFGNNALVTYKSEEYELPLRLRVLNSEKYILEIGFIKVPDELINNDIKINIKFH